MQYIIKACNLVRYLKLGQFHVNNKLAEHRTINNFHKLYKYYAEMFH